MSLNSNQNLRGQNKVSQSQSVKQRLRFSEQSQGTPNNKSKFKGKLISLKIF